MRTVLTAALANWQPTTPFWARVKLYLPISLVLGAIAASAMAGGAFEHAWDCG
jgi:hypothetical protein